MLTIQRQKERNKQNKRTMAKALKKEMEFTSEYIYVNMKTKRNIFVEKISTKYSSPTGLILFVRKV
jgi:hypothetical protein